ncbi:MAG: HAD-IIA family hydrolase [Calditrichaeota bacterium]|nr:MAG: HAD-IIA family hydrolase [Calditrichota bacterium]
MLTETEFKQRLQNIECFAIDLDGTTYLGDRVFPYTSRFISFLRETNRSFLFITNNSSKTPQNYIDKFRSFGLEFEKDLIYTSADATIEYLKKKKVGKKLYILGTKALIDYFLENGFSCEESNPDAVVVGFDLELNYSRLQVATNLLIQGVPFYATHPDFTCPVENGTVLPDCGAITAALTAASGRKPFVLGKPHTPMFEGVLRRTGSENSKIAVIGDRLMTDIEIGRQNNLLSILVLTGETNLAMLQESTIQPDFVVPSLEDLIPFF